MNRERRWPATLRDRDWLLPRGAFHPPVVVRESSTRTGLIDTYLEPAAPALNENVTLVATTLSAASSVLTRQ